MEQESSTEVGSYFISNYPPFSVWSDEYLQDAEAALDSSPSDNVPLGLYLHIPFCRKRCKFCYFRVYTDKKADEIERYVSALSREIELVGRQQCMGDRPFRFVYFGGGTPSFLSPRQLTSLVDRLRENISWDLAEEVTFECEPGTLSETKVKTLADIGVTRLSLGVENFSDAILQENGRAHLSGEIWKAWQWIQDADFLNINIDLIAGMVGESWDNWKDCIRKTIDMNPESVTVYQMELPFNTTYSKDILGDAVAVSVADWPTKRDWVNYAFDELSGAGYQVSSAYTMVRDSDTVHFRYRDHLWEGADLLATGVASFGHISGVHYQNHPDWTGYLSALEAGRLPLNRAYRPTTTQALIREMVLQLKKGELKKAYFMQKFSVDVVEQWCSVWKSYQADQLLTITEDGIRLTRDGLLRVDSLLPAFFEPAHQGIRYT